MTLYIWFCSAETWENELREDFSIQFFQSSALLTDHLWAFVMIFFFWLCPEHQLPTAVKLISEGTFEWNEAFIISQLKLYSYSAARLHEGLISVIFNFSSFQRHCLCSWRENLCLVLERVRGWSDVRAGEVLC